MDDRVGLGLSSDSPETFRQLMLVTQDLLPQVWPQVEHLFLENSEQWEELFTIESIKFSLHKGVMQLWTMNDRDEFMLALITEVLQFPKKTLVNLLFLAGSDLREGLKFLDCVEMWGRKQGAVTVVGAGIPAVARMLKSYGYEIKTVRFSKNISGMREH